MRKRNGAIMRQVLAAVFLSALAIAAMLGLIGSAGAADLSEAGNDQTVYACGEPQEKVILFQHDGAIDFSGHPTVPARTPYFTCVTGTVLLPGDIPPPPEYCCP
jgi:hypothetical protein